MSAAPSRLLLFLVLAGLAGCVAEMVERKKPRKGPVPEIGLIDYGGGEVRYSVEGWGFVVAARRREALRRARRVCKGQLLKVTEEFARDDVEIPYAGDEIEDNIQRGLEHYKVAPYHHIVFECAPRFTPGAPPPAVSLSTAALLAPPPQPVQPP